MRLGEKKSNTRPRFRTQTDNALYTAQNVKVQSSAGKCMSIVENA
jgi:hypothetical protein